MMAGRLHGIPTFGTMAHSFVEAFGSEEESFRAYRASFSDSSTFLVDTYDTIDGVKTAIEVAREMERQGHLRHYRRGKDSHRGGQGDGAAGTVAKGRSPGQR
jgi:nicotinic acid phosphoribosyltransferase